MAPTINRDDVVARYWPYEGPLDDEAITSAAETLAGLVRYLNNATRGDLPVPTLYELLGDLAASTAGMRQLVGQLVDTTDRYGNDTSLRHDTHRNDPGTATHAAKLATQALRAPPSSTWWRRLRTPGSSSRTSTMTSSKRGDRR